MKFTQYNTETGKYSIIFTAKELTDIVSDNLAYYEEEAKDATERANKTHEEVAAEIQNEYAAENARLKEQLRFSYGAFSSEKELTNWHNFVKEHEYCRLKTKIAGGQMPYIIPYETGVGQVVTAVCQVCGAKKDITDTSIW